MTTSLSAEHRARIDAARRGETTTLDLSGAPIRDLRALQGLTGLTRLKLAGCADLTDVSRLAGLKGLKELSLYNCRALSTLELHDLPALRKLSITRCTAL